MPHDRKGQQLKIGDIVMIPAIITGVDRHDEYINVAVDTIEPMFPGEHKTPILLNAHQVEIVHPSLGVIVVSEIDAPPPENADVPVQ